MKKLIVIFLLLLVLLSSCGYTVDDINAMQSKFDEQYYSLEDKYDKAVERVDVLETFLSDINDNFATVYCYYDDADPDISEEEAHDALLKIRDLLFDAGY